MAQETYIACLTPPGRGAIATLALRGPNAWSLVRDLFQLPSPRHLPSEPEPGRFWLGRLGETGAMDEVVLAVRQKMPVPWLEVHCHGGMEVVGLFKEVFCRRGVRECSWEEFERLTAEEANRSLARTLLARTPTVRTAAILLDQVHGAFDNAIQQVCLALRKKDLETAKTLLDHVKRFAPVGRHLVDPWRVVIAGAPNVGKSSLVNALAGYTRCVVGPTPGTTRDVVTTLLAIDGWPVEVADTAGWRTQAEPLEAAGIERARAAATGADLCLWVLDASTAPEFPQEPVLVPHTLINKIDLPAAWDLNRVAGALRVSAKTGVGITDLCHFLSQALVPVAPPPGAAVPFTPAIADRVQRAFEECEKGNVAAALALLEASFSGEP